MTTTVSESVTTRQRTVALVGNPNTGKSTLFNALTGYRQRIGNYPGVTVEKRTGPLKRHGGQPVELIDLPGTYGLAPHSEDEAIVLDVLLGRIPGTPEPDAFVVVVDASHLSRNLFLTSQLLELGKPTVVALNMMDEAEAAGLQIEVDVLRNALGVPVVPCVATRQHGVDRLIDAIESSFETTPSARPITFPPSIAGELDGLTASMEAHGNGHPMGLSRAEALQTLLTPGGLHEQRTIERYGHGLADELAARRGRIVAAGESVIEVEARVRYEWINRIVEQAVRRVRPERDSWSARVDRILTNRVLGLGILVLLMGLCFQAIYSWAGPLMDAVEGTFGAIGGAVSAVMPEGALQSLVVDGVIAGVGAVLVFLPQILILFLFLAVLEDCGYMARAAFLLDRWMGYLGLSGKSFIPLLSSFACAVPGIMATRTIENRRDRLVTILVAPLMSCSARLPVYILLIGAFIPATPLLGGLMNLQAATLLGLYMVGVVVAIAVTFVLKHTLLKGEPQSFLMELPRYRWPSPRIVVYRVYEQGREFCVSAGTIIFAVTVVIWALGYYPRPTGVARQHDAMRAAAKQRYEEQLDRIASAYRSGMTGEAMLEVAPIAETLERIEREETAEGGGGAAPEGNGTPESAVARSGAVAADSAQVDESVEKTARAVYQARTEFEAELARIDRQEAGGYLRQSVLGRMGQWIEPAVKPLGWDWRIGTAAIASFPAREVVIATMGTIYNLGSDTNETSTSLREKLHAATWSDGSKVFSIPVALSIMVFFALCCQCGGTLAVIKRETRSWRYPLLTFTYMTALAYVAALLTYQIGAAIG